jgi:hypothetical protein
MPRLRVNSLRVQWGIIKLRYYSVRGSFYGGGYCCSGPRRVKLGECKMPINMLRSELP